MSAYNVYLQGEHWRTFREKTILDRNGKCEHCGLDENLVVHHITYETLGNEKPEDVLVLCNDCHENIHIKKKSGKARFNNYGFKNYHKNIITLSEELKEKDIYFLVKISDYLYWDTGQLFHKRDKRPVKYKDLVELMGYSKKTTNDIIKSLREKGILYTGDNGGYFILEDMYKGKHK